MVLALLVIVAIGVIRSLMWVVGRDEGGVPINSFAEYAAAYEPRSTRHDDARGLMLPAATAGGEPITGKSTPLDEPADFERRVSSR